MRFDPFSCSFWLCAATAGLVAAALMAGCDGQIPVGETVAAASVPTLSFNADWTVTASAPLQGGGSAVLHYAPERLPQCRTVYHGGPAWGITANWAADGGFARSTAVVQFIGGANVPVDAPISIPFGKDLALWFHNTDVGGCSTWDSNYGRDFHFAIQAPPEPVLHFRGNFTQDGSAHAGADFLVDYDLIRASQCRGQSNGYQAWEITAHARFSDGTTQDRAVTRVVGMNSRDAAPARFSAPGAAKSVELWFENTDVYGCHAWDSNYGSNYRFSL